MGTVPSWTSVPAATMIAVPGTRRLTKAKDSPNATRKMMGPVHSACSLMNSTSTWTWSPTVQSPFSGEGIRTATRQRTLIGGPLLKACKKIDEVRIVAEKAAHLCRL